MARRCSSPSTERSGTNCHTQKSVSHPCSGTRLRYRPPSKARLNVYPLGYGPLRLVCFLLVQPCRCHQRAHHHKPHGAGSSSTLSHPYPAGLLTGRSVRGNVMRRKVLTPDERAALIQEEYGGKDCSWNLQRACAAHNAAQQDQQRKAIQAQVIRRPKGFLVSAPGAGSGWGMRK